MVKLNPHYRFGGTNSCPPKKKPATKMTDPQLRSTSGQKNRLENWDFFHSTAPRYRAQSLCDSVGLSVHFLGKLGHHVARWKAPGPPQQKRTEQKRGHKIIRVSFCFCFHAFFVCLLSFKAKIA